MPTYEITAPNGKTYRVDGPKNATQEQIRNEILRQHPDAASTAAPTARPNAPMSVAETRTYLQQGGKLKTRNFGEDVAAFGAGMGAGFGNMVLTGERLVGGGLNRIGLGAIGQPLVNDANTGINRLAAALEPYKAEHPNITAAGEIASTLPVGGAAGRAVGGIARAAGVGAKAAPLVTALETGGFRTGMIPSAAARAAGAAAPTLATRTGDVLLRGAGGAVTGGAGAAAMNPNEAGTGAAWGAAIPFAGQALGAVGRKVISPVTKRLSAEEQRLAQIAQQNGITLTPGQMTGSRPLLNTESALTQMPFSSGLQRNVFENQRSQFNQAVLEKAGITADHASPEVLDQAFGDIGQRFNNVIANTGPITVTPKFGSDINNVANTYGRRLEANVAPIFTNLSDEIKAISAPGTKIPSDVYKNIASDLRRTIRQNTANPALQDALRGLQNALDDLMEFNVPASVADEWKAVRGDYRNLLIIDKAMAQAPDADKIAANIPFGSFSRAVSASDRSGFARGRGDLNDLARVGSFLSNRIPDSGTAERSNIIRLLQGGGGLATGLAAGTATGLPVAGAAAGLALPPAVQAFLNSTVGRAYLTNELAGKIPQIGNAALVSALTASLTKQDQEQPQ